MILSHRHRFVFVRTRKTASTSIELALRRWAGPDDIVTPLGDRDEKIASDLGIPGPRNWASGDGDPFYNHMPATEIISAVGADLWSAYHTFCFDRNPWDKVISLYYHRHKSDPRPPFDEFVFGGEAADAVNFGIYTVDGAPVVDRVHRYEELDTAIDEITARLGLPCLRPLQTAKSQFRIDRRPWREILTEPQATHIAKIFSAEIAYHGYRF
jgi:hypothetical protein